MKRYDISQEVFSCLVFPGDPAPEVEQVLKIENGDSCNLTKFGMCSHNGTHVDAPRHFIPDGKTIDQVKLDQYIGMAWVTEEKGILTAEDAMRILTAAANFEKNIRIESGKCSCHCEHNQETKSFEEMEKEAEEFVTEACWRRILVKGKAELSAEAARVFADFGIYLFGNESQTVGPENAPAEVHQILLGAEITLLEGIRLGDVPAGRYLLHAAPLNLGGCEGAPCRATLLEL